MKTYTLRSLMLSIAAVAVALRLILASLAWTNDFDRGGDEPYWALEVQEWLKP